MWSTCVSNDEFSVDEILRKSLNSRSASPLLNAVIRVRAFDPCLHHLPSLCAMSSPSDSVPLHRLSVDMFSEILQYLGGVDLRYFFAVCTPRLRLSMTAEAVKHFVVQPFRSDLLSSPPLKTRIKSRAFSTFGRGFTCFHGLQRLIIHRSALYATPYSCFPAETIASLPKTLRVLELDLSQVLASFATADCQSSLLEGTIRAAPEWIPMKALFPRLERLVLRPSPDGLHNRIVWRIRDVLGFLAQLPDALGSLHMGDFPGLDLNALRLLPPRLTDLGVSNPTFVASTQLAPTAANHFSLSVPTENAAYVLNDEVLSALPPHLIRLQFNSSVRNIPGSNPFSRLPPQLSSLKASIESPWRVDHGGGGPGGTHEDDTISFPPQLTKLDFYLSNYTDSTFKSQVKFPDTLKKLKITLGSNASFPSSHIASLPRTLRSLDFSNVRISISATTWTDLPPQLTKLQAMSSTPPLLHQLPRTLTFLSIHWRSKESCIDPLEVLPPTMEHISLSGLVKVTRSTFPAFPRLRRLHLPNGFMDDQLLLSLPSMLVQLVVEVITASGLFLPQDITSLTRADLIDSVQDFIRARGVSKVQYSKIDALSIASCPPTVTSISDISYENIKPRDLPRGLTEIFMPYHMLPEEIPDLPPSLTTLNCDFTVPATLLSSLPNTLRKLKRATIINDIPVATLMKEERTEKVVSFPDYPNALLMRMLPSIQTTVATHVDILPEHFDLIPETATSLAIGLFPYPAGEKNVFDDLRGIKNLSLHNPSLFQMFQHSLLFDDTHHGTEYLEITIDNMTDTVILPKGAQRLRLIKPGNAIRNCTWPPNLETLELVEHNIGLGAYMERLPRTLTRLAMTGAARKLADEDMQFIPASVTSLHLTHVQLTKKCLEFMPISLIEISIPKSMFPASEILKHASDKRAAIASSSTACMSDKT